MLCGGVYLLESGLVLLVILSMVAVLIITILMQYCYNSKLKHKIKNINKLKDSLYYVADRISMINNEEEIYKEILEAAVALVPTASKGSILMMEEDGKFHYKVVKGFNEKLNEIALDKEDIFLYHMNNFEETAIIKNPTNIYERVASINAITSLSNLNVLEIGSTISAPIYIDGKLVGVINVDSDDKKRGFTEDDRILMNHIKNELQLALKNSFIKNSLRYLANFDELTGSFNRRYFKQILEIELNRIREDDTEACIVFIDVDDFKYINDTYGHIVGDEALKFFSGALRNSIRSTDIYARMAGDEFVVLFLGCNENVAEQRMHNIKEKISKERLGKVKIEFSYGITYVNKDSAFTSESILNEADKKMYENKRCKVVRSIR